jgi:hypothetical protein
MKKSAILPILGICVWIILIVVPASLAQAPIARPMFSLPSCSVSQRNNGEINCSCVNGEELSFRFKQGQVILQCS